MGGEREDWVLRDEKLAIFYLADNHLIWCGVSVVDFLSLSLKKKRVDVRFEELLFLLINISTARLATFTPFSTPGTKRFDWLFVPGVPRRWQLSKSVTHKKTVFDFPFFLKKFQLYSSKIPLFYVLHVQI